MRQNIRKWFSICLCVVILVTALPITAYAQSNSNQNWLTSLFSSSSENSSAFQTLELREGSLNGTKVVDLLNPSGSWELRAGVDYYLYGEVKKTAGNDYLRICFGNEDGSYNGATFFNPPGGTYTEGKIDHDYFDQLVKYDQFDNPSYGSNNAGIIALQDGSMLYHIKSDIADNSTVNFAMGLILQDAVLSGSRTITDAIQVATGAYDNTDFTVASSKTADLQLAEKPKVAAGFNATNLMATLNDTAAMVQVNISDADKNKPAELLYDKVEYDITYPQNAIWEGVGFSSSFSKTSSSYGVMTVGEPVENGDNYTRHIVIENGYRKKGTALPMYYRLKFTSPAYMDGQTVKTSIANMTVVMKDNTEIPITTSVTPATYTILDPSKDSTAVSAINRPEVYNSTIAGANAYNVNMGGIRITNKNVSQPTPREKTYEASFNTTNTAARITVITVPTGTSDTPNVTLTGKKEDGTTVTMQVENPVNYAYTGTTKKSKVSSADCLRFHVSDFADQGLVAFTGVRAEIGSLRANYKTNSWTANWAYDANNSGAYGYFTTTETGIQVKNTFRIYNTDPNYRNVTAGDLSVTSTATSTSKERIGYLTASTYIKNADGKIVDSIAAGDTVTVSGLVFPYACTGAARSANGDGTTSYIVEPVFYMTLPKGLTYEDLSFVYGGTVTGDRNLIPSIENVSYLNTTGDGVSLYRVTFGEGKDFGYYSADGTYKTINFSFKLRTSKSMETKRYELNDLIGISTASQAEAIPYNGNPRTLNTIITDTYGLNGGNNYAGITKGGTTDQPGFGLQQLAEVNVYNAVAVTNINGAPVSEEWHAYDASDPNSIASLGANSSGKFRIKIENTSDAPATNLKIMIPIPKADTDLGNAYMTQPSQFDMKMTFEENALTEAGFTANYVTATAIDELSGDFSYTSSTSDSANAILLERDSLPGKNDEATGGKYEFTFDFTVDSGSAGSQNIWRNAFSYTTSDNVTQYKTGSYVASEVAGGTISGTVYHDSNRDGIKDTEEQGVSGVTVVAKDADNKILSTVTDSYGYYEFLAVREAEIGLSYQVAEMEVLRFNINSDAATVIPAVDGLSAAATVTAAEDTTVDAGLSEFFTLDYHKNLGSGNVPESQEYVEGAQAVVAVKPDNLLRTGYVFKEWNTLADGTGTGYQPGESFVMNENTTLYAIWELGTYHIYFNYRGATEGNTITEKQLGHNQTYNTGGALPAPLKEGYTFTGWCTTSTGTSANAKNTTKFTLGADTTLYALWSAKSGYTVSFETGEGGSEISQRTVSWEDYVIPDTEPTRTGYTFTGWKEKITGTVVTDQTTFGDLAENDVAAGLILEAQWAPKAGYTVTYALNEGSGSYETRTVAWDEAELLPENNPSKTGYAFAGWKLGDADTLITGTDTYGSLAKTEETTGITLIAAWTEVQNNTVHYSTGGGTSYSDKTNVADSDSGLIPDTEPKKAGYTFAGWTCEGKTVTADTVYSTISESNNITLAADWTAKSYTISYNVDGISEAVKGWTDSSLIPTDNPVKAGSIFAGWYYGNTEVTSTTTVAQLIPADQTTNIVLTAKWNEETFTIVYESDGGSSYAPKTAVSFSQTGLLPDSTPVKTGYNFAGWYQGDTQATDQTSCGSLTAADSVVALTAHWTPKTGYSIVYNSAGGTSVDAKTGIGWEDTGLIPETTPSRTGYTFGGWVCGRNSVSSTTAYGSLAASDTAVSITLVAQWTTGNYTVHYDTAGGNSISSKKVGWGSSNLLPATSPRLAGNTFRGWTYQNTPVTAATLYSELAGTDSTTEITLTAAYEAVSDEHDGMGTDVQGKVIETDDTPVYKIDLSWGAMKYEFSVQKGWDPETHTYSTGTQGHWNAESFDGSNNCVTAANHSNADVSLDFIVSKMTTADGSGDGEGEEETGTITAEDPFASVIMLMNRTNGDEGEAARGMFLGKVPAERAAAPQISAYLRILGEPDNISILNTNTYERVGVITVTVEAVGGDITPRD